MSYSAAVLALTPIAYWKLNETGTPTTAVDTVGTYPGTYFGSLTVNQPSPIEGSKSVKNVGNSSDGITVNTAPIIGNLSNFTWTGWVKYISTDSALYAERSSGNDICKIEMRSGNIGFIYRDDGGTLSYEGSNAGTISGSDAACALTSGAWYHVAVTRSGTTVCIYINGVLTYSWTMNSSSTTFTQTLSCRLFGDPQAAAPFNGSLDDVALFNTALTAAQIAALYLAGYTYRTSVLLDVPSLYLTLDEPSGTTVADQSGNGLTGTIGGSGSSLNNASYPGAEGKCWADAGAAWIDIGANSVIDISANWTYECWVKLNSLGDQFMMNKFYESQEAPGFVIDGTSHKLRIMKVAAGSTILLGNTVLTTGVWYHVAATLSGTTFSIYLNGVLDGTTSISVTFLNGTHLFRIGAYYSNSFPLNGSIDEVAVYNHALSASRIMAHYAAHSLYNRVIMADKPTGYWPVEDTEGTVVRDVSGGGNNATYTGDVILKQTSRIDTLAGAILLNNTGTNGEVTLPFGVASGFATSTSPKSYELWFNTADHDGPLFFLWEGSSAGNQSIVTLTLGFDVFAANTGSGKLGLVGQDHGGVGLFHPGQSSTVYADSAWHHVVITRSASHVWKVYVDGNATPVVTQTDTFTSGVNNPATGPRIGNQGPSGLYVTTADPRGYIKGLIQAIAEYDAELTPTQIAAHYAAATGAVVTNNYTDAATTPFVTTYSGFEGSRYTEAATATFKTTPSDTQSYGHQDAASIRFVTSVITGETSSFRPRGSWGSFDDDDGIIP